MRSWSGNLRLQASPATRKARLHPLDARSGTLSTVLLPVRARALRREPTLAHPLNAARRARSASHDPIEATNAMTERSESEVFDRYVAIMGEPLGPVFHQLFQEFSRLQDKWSVFRELFGHSPERIDIMNRCAPHTFRVLQDSLYETVIAHLARLTDPDRTGRYSNLSIRALPDLVRSDLKGTVKEMCERTLAAAERVRVLRDKTYAHLDREIALERESSGVMLESRSNIANAIESAIATFNLVGSAYGLGHVVFAPSLRGMGGAVVLMSMLEGALEDRGSRRTRGLESN